MSQRITLASGVQRAVSDADADRIKQAMQGVGVLAFHVRLDGRSSVFINAAAVLIVEPIDDEGGAAS